MRFMCKLQGYAISLKASRKGWGGWIEIQELYNQVDESRAACEAVTNVAAIIPNRQEEIKRWKFSCKYSNLQLTMEKISAQEYVPRLRISRQFTYEGACDTKKKILRTFRLTWNYTFL